MFVIEATDDYNVKTRFVVGCHDQAINLAHVLDRYGFQFIHIEEMERENLPERSEQEIARAQEVLFIIHEYTAC